MKAIYVEAGDDNPLFPASRREYFNPAPWRGICRFLNREHQPSGA